MKKIAWCFFTCLLSLCAHSQWTTSGTNIYNSNTGNVGVGTSTPSYPLHIKGQHAGLQRSLYIENVNGSPTFSVDDLGTGYMTGLDVNQGSVNIHAPATNIMRFTGDGASSAALTFYSFTDVNHQSYSDIGCDSAGINFDSRTHQVPMRFLHGPAGSVEGLAMFSTGNIGINVASVDNGNRFQVNGNLWTTGFMLPTGAGAGKVLTSDASGTATWQTPTGGSGSGWSLNGNTDGVIKSIGTADNYDFPIITNNVERLRVTAGGNVAIGTTNPQGYMLAVNGSAIFTAVWVKPNANWPDYVFQKDYRLPGLDSVSRYIQINKHLPDLPSAETVAKTGIDLGGNQTVLLKKVEELTLYLIDQDKTMRDYKQKIADQQQQLEAQHRQLEDQQRRLERLEKMMNK